MEEEISKYLIDEFGSFGIFGYLILILLLIPIVLKFSEVWFTNWLLNSKNKILVRMFREEKSIKCCLDEYVQLERSSKGLVQILMVYSGLFCGFMLPLLLFIITFLILKISTEKIIPIDYLYHYAFSISNLIVSLIFLILIVKLYNNIKSLEPIQLISKFKNYYRSYFFIIFFALSFFAYNLLINYSFLHAMISLKFPSELHFKIIIFINLIAFLFSLLLITKSIIDKKYFLGLLRSALNQKWFMRFPMIYIITSAGVEIRGKVKDAFNSDYIILNDNGNQIIILWSSIISIEFIMDSNNY